MPASELLPNERNRREHSPEQANALRGILAEIGWADAVLAYPTPDGLKLIDGHLRAEVAPDAEVPVLVLDVTDDEAVMVLATHDPLTNMATADAAKLDELLADRKKAAGGQPSLGAAGGQPSLTAHDQAADLPVQRGRINPLRCNDPRSLSAFRFRDGCPHTACVTRIVGNPAIF